TLDQALLSSFLGLKVRPVDPNEELGWRVSEVQEKIAALEKNLRDVATQAAQGRVSQKFADQVWEEGLKQLDLLFRQYAALLAPTEDELESDTEPPIGDDARKALEKHGWSFP